MNVTTDQIRDALDEMSEAGAAPDPTTLVGGARREVTRLKRRRQTGWLGAAAAAVAAIGGASLLLTDLGGDTQGEVAPAKPDESYTAGYGYADGELEPYTSDGLRLLDQVDLVGGETAQVEVDSSEQVYAAALCWDGSNEVINPSVTVTTGSSRLGMACSVVGLGAFGSMPMTALPSDPESDGTYDLRPTDGLYLITVGFYVEEDWSDYPFSAPESPPFPPTSDRVIDSNTPKSDDPTLEALVGDTRVHSVTVPVPEESMTLYTMLRAPGQVLVAVDGLVISNDGEDLDRLDPEAPGVPDQADPSVRKGYVHSFGEAVLRGWVINRQMLA